MHFLVALLPLFAAEAATSSGLTDAEIDGALHGQVIARTESFDHAGKAAGRGLGAVVIERPVGEVWATLAHPDDKAEYMPRVKSVTVLSREPNLLHLRMEVDASVTTARYTAWFKLDEPARVLSWTLDHNAPDNTIADVEGEYHLYVLQPTRTLVVYRTYVDAGRSVPSFVQGYMTRQSLPNLLHAVKSRIESGGRFHK